MKFIASIVLIILLSAGACLYLPWWSIAIAAFIVSALIPQKPAAAFFAGFIALFLFWGFWSWYLSNNNNHLLAHKVSMIILQKDSVALLITATALVGALVAGFAALAGSYLRKP